MRPIALSLLLAAMAGATLAQAAPAAPMEAKTGPGTPGRRVALKAPDGSEIGSVVVLDGPTGVLVTVEAKGLTPGWHGMHFHEKGDCSDAAFKNSGGHMNHDPKLTHGLLAPSGPDFGDLPNLWIAQDGTGKAQAFSTAVSLTTGTPRAALLDADGSALVIHAAPDDQKTQPIGGAGARVACAVIGA